jgi:hypothetical protein
MNAPERYCVAVAEVLERAGVETSVLGVAQPRVGYRALVLGRSFAIAREFAFERRSCT